MPKYGFPMPTAKNGFHIFNLHPKKYMYLKKYPFLNANLLEKFLTFNPIFCISLFLYVYFLVNRKMFLKTY